jgi:hypothetical protein
LNLVLVQILLLAVSFCCCIFSCSSRKKTQVKVILRR